MPYKNNELRRKHYREKHPEVKRVKGVRHEETYYYPKSTKDSQLKRAYGISLEDYNNMFTEQEGKCAICGRHQSELTRALCVDHNHQTGEVRGLLCHSCNTALGSLGDDVNRIQKAVVYLSSYNIPTVNEEG